MSQNQSLAGLQEMLSLVDSLPDQLAAAVQLPGLQAISAAYSQPRRIVLCAMGGSAIGGDLVQGLLNHQAISVDVWRNYGLPHWVTSEDLVVAASYSGNTEECLSVVSDARLRDIPVLAISSGGELAGLLKQDEVRVELPGGLPPRAALGFSFGALLGVLDQLGLIANLSGDLAETIEVLKNKPFCGTSGPESLARDLEGKIPVIFSADSFLGPVACRWQGQLNENSKVPAMMAEFPELNHNNIVGWGLSQSWQDRFVLIILRTEKTPERIQKRVDLTCNLIQGEFSAVHLLTASGESVLAKVLSLVQYGDYLSCHLAGIRSVDPMPVQRIDQLKDGLAK